MKSHIHWKNATWHLHRPTQQALAAPVSCIAIKCVMGCCWWHMCTQIHSCPPFTHHATAMARGGPRAPRKTMCMAPGHLDSQMLFLEHAKVPKWPFFSPFQLLAPKTAPMSAPNGHKCWQLRASNNNTRGTQTKTGHHVNILWVS